MKSPAKCKRILLLLTLGLLALGGMRAWQLSQLPAAVPEPWQASGREIIIEQLAVLRASVFGQTERGRILTDRVQDLLEADKIVFSAELGGPRGMWSRGFLMPERVYLRILPMKNGYLHMTPGQIMEALVHEAVHAINDSPHGNSRQEECDAFAAGIVAELTVDGQPVPAVLMVDGLPLWTFIEQAYPNEPEDADYQPVALPLESLYRMSGR